MVLESHSTLTNMSVRSVPMDYLTRETVAVHFRIAAGSFLETYDTPDLGNSQKPAARSSIMNLSISIRTPISRQEEMDFVVQILVDMLAPNEFGLEESEPLLEKFTVADREYVNSPDATRDSGSGVSQTKSMGNPPSEVVEAEIQNEEDSEVEYLVGRLWAERLDWFLAEACGYSIQSICDERSGTWLQVLETLSRNGGKSFRKDLNLNNHVADVVFIHELLIHPELTDRVALLDAAMREISGEHSLILMYHEQTESYHLEDWECRDLGFKKIARSNLLLRDNHFRYPFGDAHPAGRKVGFTATAEHENWLLEQWDELIVDHPSL